MFKRTAAAPAKQLLVLSQSLPPFWIHPSAIGCEFEFMRSLPSGCRPSRPWIYLAAPSISFFLVACYLFRPDSFAGYGSKVSLGLLNSTTPPSEVARCAPIPGLEDVHVVLKTGATELLQKLPVHFDTTFRCLHNFTIFSDYEEVVSGFHIHDVLRGVDENIKNTHPDFELYTGLRDSGREFLATWNITDHASTPSGKPNNPGWVLDKWKFLPMMHETLSIRSDAKWYVFMEADTYIVWENLVAWLQRFDSNQLHYLGSQMQIGDVIFAHGGSGFVLSQAAMRAVTEFYSSQVEKWDVYTDHHWAGDCVLGKALNEAGVSLLWSWPMLQGSTPWTLDHLSTAYIDKRPWCYPPIAYHHMTSNDVRAFWQFEQDWRKENFDSILLHKDVFQKLIQPRLTQVKEDWDNASPDVITGVDSAADCQVQCDLDEECFQYSYESNTCHSSRVVQRGIRKPGYISGWMPERITDAAAKHGSCEKIDWILP